VEAVLLPTLVPREVRTVQETNVGPRRQRDLDDVSAAAIPQVGLQKLLPAHSSILPERVFVSRFLDLREPGEHEVEDLDDAEAQRWCEHVEHAMIL
jgi:hypothetical protein